MEDFMSYSLVVLWLAMMFLVGRGWFLLERLSKALDELEELGKEEK